MTVRCNGCLDALHDTLDRALTEVIAVALHGQTVHTDSNRLFMLLIVLIVIIIAVISSQFQNTICNEIFTSTVALHNSFNQILRYIGIICQQLFSVLREAIPAARCQVLDNFFYK